jgi:hypothetical protein
MRPANAFARGTATVFHTWTNGEIVPHIASILSVCVLSAAFMKNVYMGKVDGFDYIIYAVAMAASASPSLMYKLIALKFTGQPIVEEEKK